MLQETVAAAQKEVAAMGAMTSSMANELVDAREQARFHEVTPVSTHARDDDDDGDGDCDGAEKNARVA